MQLANRQIQIFRIFLNSLFVSELILYLARNSISNKWFEENKGKTFFIFRYTEI